MSNWLRNALSFVLARLREPGSQRAISALAGLGGVTVTGPGWDALLWTVATLSAAAAVLLPERRATVIAAATPAAAEAAAGMAEPPVILVAPASPIPAGSPKLDPKLDPVEPNSAQPSLFPGGPSAATIQGVSSMLNISTLFGLFSAGQEAIQAVKDLEADRVAGKLSVDDVAKHVANLAAAVAAAQVNSTVTTVATQAAAVATALTAPVPATTSAPADTSVAAVGGAAADPAPAGN